MPVRPARPEEPSRTSVRPPLVDLPGAGGLAAFWRPVAELLRPRSESLLVEYPGFGETPPDSSIRSVSDLLDMFLKRLPASFDVVAQSLTTHDVDIVHARTPANLDRLMAALTKVNARYRGRAARFSRRR